MKKLKILLFFLMFFSLFVFEKTFSYSVPVTEVFSDIKSDYKYINELQTLYDKWMISPDKDWKFNPKELLNRDEFVWIVEEVTCKNCIQPFTAYDLVKQYEDSKIFFDINKNNKYFYCIADANTIWNVSWYQAWTKCEDWTNKDWEKPFCPNNTIILEEALSIILRASAILTNEDADKVRVDIAKWYITENLADDLSPKNPDWSVYSFYPDFKRALDYEVVDVDKDWNVSNLKLIDVVDWKIHPKQAISKEDFLKMAYVALKANSCIEKQQNNVALNLYIRDSKCSESDKNCQLSSFDSKIKTYDFWLNISTKCESGVKEPEWYIWRFYNNSSWEEIKKYWKYVDNFQFDSSWEWKIFARVVDNCWNTWEVYNTMYISNWNTWINDWLWVKIIASKLTWDAPLDVDFEWIVEWWKWPYTFNFDFWDWSKGNWSNISHTFNSDWSYIVWLTVTDKDWKKWYSNLNVSVWNTWLWVKINASKLTWSTPLDVDFEWLVEWWEWPYTFNFDFWDWSSYNWNKTVHRFNNDGTYEVNLVVTDKNWKKWNSKLTIYSYLNLDNIQNPMNVNTSSIIWKWPMSVDFWIDWGVWDYVYFWDFWDWNTAYWKNVSNVFKDQWVYNVALYTTDKNWNVTSRTSTILVDWLNEEKTDSDLDWVYDSDDLCPLIKWSGDNKWCPILEEKCSATKDCKDWFFCNDKWICESNELSSSCEYSWWDVIFWNAICNSCPCDYNLDFISTLRKCDVIFPAIVSPDNKDIYSRGEFYQIK